VTDITQWTSAARLITDQPMWVPEEDRERLAAYTVYDNMYWSEKDAFKLSIRGDNDKPIYVPNPRTIVDTTSHYLLKGLNIGFAGSDPDAPDNAELSAFLKREKFYSRFHVSKHAGVTRGDHLLHLTADPRLPPGRRISLTTVDPGRYFPVYDDDDVDLLLAVHLADQVWYPKDQKFRVHRLTYRYVSVSGTRRVSVEEAVFEMEGWHGFGDHLRLFKTLQTERLLPEQITTIPVYHFKNIDWQGAPFGHSEIKGFERIQAGVNQALSDEDISLALTGLGVFATDSGRPVDDEGNEEDWVIAPAKVMEVPGGSYFRRVEGIGSVTPMLDHANFLQDSMYEASATFRAGLIDVAVAESGAALAIRFLPTLAKLEERDNDGVDTLTQLWFDWRSWELEFEGVRLPNKDIEVTIGQKLPTSRKEALNELNNMLDRNVISRKFYRAQMARLMDYSFPSNMEEEILAEIEKFSPVPPPNQGGDPAQQPPDPNQSNNKGRPNESGGTEAG
jgi:hypothetical protein